MPHFLFLSVVTVLSPLICSWNVDIFSKWMKTYSLQWDGKASFMERYTLGTHRGLFQAGLEIRKIKLSGLEGTSYRLKAFNLIVQTYNSSSYRIIRDCSPCGSWMSSQVCVALVAFNTFHPHGAKSTALLFHRVFLNWNKIRVFKKVVAQKLPQGLFV